MKKIIICLLCAFSCIFVYAQKTVTGTVTAADTKESLPQVSVKVKGTTTGAVSDLDGKFSITVPDTAKIIVFSYVGYSDKEVDVSAISGELSIALETKDIGLNPVVVSASRSEEKILDAPASITVIGTEKIESQVTTTAIDHLQYTPGVDVMKTGIVCANVVPRGFNNIFSTATMVIVDNRIASVPSLRVNAYQLIPTANNDLERMEIVRGPGSALYGPNAADGVFAMFTKSPLDIDRKWEGTVTVGMGTRAKGDDSVTIYQDSAFVTKGVDEGSSIVDRGLINPEARLVVKLNDRIGFKVSGGYLGANDWKYYDKREPQIGDTLILGTAQNGEAFIPDSTIAPRLFDRDFDIKKANADARIDFRLSKDVDIILSGGMAMTTNLELTGLGAAQGKKWICSYAQARLRWKKLYFQYFLNSSNAGETFLIPQANEPLHVKPSTHEVQLLIDKSKLHVLQLQHSSKPMDKLRFIYGADALFTVPITEGTINGRFEDQDNITQIGGYGQGEWDIISKLTLVGALRLDWHDQVEGVFLSPRAAIVFKPTSRHTLRATYNRAFSSPSTLNLSLDLSNGLIPNGINARGIGSPDGYSYRGDGENEILEFITPYADNDPNTDDEWYLYTDNSKNYMFFDSLSAIIAKIGGIPSTIMASLINGIGGPNGTISSVQNILVDYVKLNETDDFSQSLFDLNNIKEVAPIDNQITQTWEIGYKGILWDKVYLTADFYYTKVSDYVSPLTNSTASVMFDPVAYRAAFGDDSTGLLRQNLDKNGGLLDNILVQLIDGDFGGEVNGTAWDELINIFTGAAAQIPNGSITPDDPLVNSDIILTYKNLGDITVGGMDLGLTYVINEKFTAGGAYSYVTKDSIPLDGAQLGYVALNAPRHKLALTLEHTCKTIGLKSRIAYRWQDSYPANSAVYVGTVKAAHYLDLGFTYQVPKVKGFSIALDIQNVTNNKHKPFVGTPSMGTMAILRLSYTFGGG